LGQKVSVADYEHVFAMLLSVAPRDALESNADYQRRIAQMPAHDQASVILPIVAERRGDGLSYDSDRRVLNVYRAAFGAGRVNFGAVFHDSLTGHDDNFASAIGFRLGMTVVKEETYQASNAFGANVTVTRTIRDVRTVWERAGKIGEGPFFGMRRGLIAQLPMAPDNARELIERGSTALLIVPRSPYKAIGVSTLEPTFQWPVERVDHVRVLIADVQCGFLLNSQSVVAQAFSSK
jgi:hypothetical protein